VVADFGIASAAARATLGGATLEGAAADAAADAGADASAGVASAPGPAFGTPGYMAPEQTVPGAPVDHRADLYALGVVAYELLAGAPPFRGDSQGALLAAHRAAAPPPLAARRPDVPPPLAALVMRLLAKRPADRPPSARAVLEALGDIAAAPARGRPPGPRPAARVGAAGGRGGRRGLGVGGHPAGHARGAPHRAHRRQCRLDPRRIVVAPLEDGARANASTSSRDGPRTGSPRRSAARRSWSRWTRAHGVHHGARGRPHPAACSAPTDRCGGARARDGRRTVTRPVLRGPRPWCACTCNSTDDAAYGTVRRAFGSLSGTAGDLGALVERVSRAAAGHTAAAVDTSAAGRGVGRSAPPSYDAYREANRAWARFYVSDFPRRSPTPRAPRRSTPRTCCRA
jgi:hypothetical protein